MTITPVAPIVANHVAAAAFDLQRCCSYSLAINSNPRPAMNLSTLDALHEQSAGAQKQISGGDATAVRRVLHVINGEHYAGAERVQDLLAARLGEFGFEVALACVKPGQFAAARRYKSARLIETPMQGRFDWRPALRLARIVRNEGFALIHTHSSRTALVGSLAARLAGVPLVHHVHSPTARDTTHRIRNRLNVWAERISLSRAKKLVAVSNSLGDYLREQGVADERIRVVHNGVPQVDGLPDRPAPSTEWTFGTVALFRPRKGLETALEALRRLRLQGAPARLRAIGAFETPEYEAKIRALVDSLGLADAVDWTGFTRDVHGELARIDAMILPSLFGEGLPMVVLEAMAAGVPVVATKIEGAPEAIRDGQDGLLVAPGDAAELAHALRGLIDGRIDWNALRRSALARHGEKFSDEAMARGVAAVYRETLDAA
jgi:glycosyltransferase involved in cell wall biosynthesis